MKLVSIQLYLLREVSMHGKKLFVGNIDNSITADDIKELFSKCGEIDDLQFVGDKGFAFIEMSTQVEAETAKKDLDGHKLKGRSLNVREARKNMKNSRRSFRRR